MPSQWKARSPVTFQFNCCKVCSPDGFFVDRGTLKSCCDNVEMNLNLLKDLNFDWIKTFQDWIDTPLLTRPAFSSRCGILMMRPNGVSREYLHPAIGDQYQEPGNYVYAFAMRLMWPDCHYNKETMGKIFKGFIGDWYENHESWTPAGLQAHMRLQSFLYWVYWFAYAAKDDFWPCKSLKDVQALAAKDKCALEPHKCGFTWNTRN